MEIALNSVKSVNFNDRKVSKVLYSKDGTLIQVWPINKESHIAGILVESRTGRLQLLSESNVDGYGDGYGYAIISFNSIVLLRMLDGSLESVESENQHNVIPFKIETFAIGIACYFGEYSSLQGTGSMPEFKESFKIKGSGNFDKTITVYYGLDEDDIMFWEGTLMALTLRIPSCGIEDFKRLYCGAFYPYSLYFEELELIHVPNNVIDPRFWDSVLDEIKIINKNNIKELSSGMFEFMDLVETSIKGTYKLNYKVTENTGSEYKYFNIVVKSKANQSIVGTFVQEYHSENRIYFGVCQTFINKDSDIEKYIQTASSIIFEGKEINEIVEVNRILPKYPETANRKFSIAIPKNLESTINVELSISNVNEELEKIKEIEWDNIIYSIWQSKKSLERGKKYSLKIK